MTFEEIKQGEETYIMHTYGRFPIALDHGKGATLWDTEGKKYIDLTSGIGVNSLGHDNEALTTAVSEQAHKLMHACNLYYTEPMVQAAKKLVDATGMGKIFFANSGAEANEGMIKLARKYSFDKYGEGRNKIITLKQSFHGRTVTTLKATGQDKFHQYFFPFTEGFDYAAANDIEDMKRKIDGTTCAVMMEMIQGEGGVLPLDKEFHIHSEISINQTYFFTITMLNPHIAPYKTAGFLESLYQIFCSILPSFHISFKLLLFNQTRFS